MTVPENFQTNSFSSQTNAMYHTIVMERIILAEKKFRNLTFDRALTLVSKQIKLLDSYESY